MAEWEYQTLVARGNFSIIQVLSVNGDPQETVVEKGKGFLSADKHISLHEYLNSAGRAGWEVVGISPLDDTGERGGQVSVLIILKRAIQGR